MVLLQLEEQPLLIQAIFAGEVNDFKTLLQYKQDDVNGIDCEKRTALHAAAYCGNTEILSLLLQHGARVNAKDTKWTTPLHRACAMGEDEATGILLKHQADVNARDRLWQTPLHVAAANNAYMCVEQLIHVVNHVDVTDRAGRTALHHAAYNGHVYVAELLISSGCIVNACDKKDCRPLHYAVQAGHTGIIELLLKYGADINAKDRNQDTPLHLATHFTSDDDNNKTTIYRMLLAAGADIDAENAFGNTPLHIACLHGDLIGCRELVANGANVEAVNYRGHRALHIAAASQNGVDCLNYLISQRVEIDVVGMDGRTPLHMSAIYGRFTRSKTLIDNGANVNAVDKNNSTPLHIAAQFGHELLANTLLSFGADPNRPGYEGRTPLHMCCLSGFVECCRKILQAGVNINAKDESGRTAIHCAAYKGSIECLDLLVSNGGNFLLKDNLGRLPLHYAASSAHYQCVFTLVGIGSPTNAVDVDGCTPLHFVAAWDLSGAGVEYLLAHRADPMMLDGQGFMPLHYAIGGGNEAAVGLLLAVPGNGVVFDGVKTTGCGITPLHLAAKLGNVDILRQLLGYYHGVDVQTEKEGYTPLMLAARYGHTQCVNYLLRHSAKVALCDHNKLTAVHYSAHNGHEACLELLLHNTEDATVMDMLDNQHRTALMLAVSGNHLECVQCLLKCGADPNIIDTDDHSCLFRAVVKGLNNIVQLLLSNSAKVQIVDVNGKTVLHLAAACGHFECLQMILSYMQEKDALIKDNQQCTALHWACYNGHADCVQHLLQRNIYDSLDGSWFSPMHCATFSGSVKCLELLVNHFGGSIVHLRDSRERCPLHIASIHGPTECVKYLIEQGADVQVFDDDGRTPLIVAAQYGQCASIELLLSSKADRKSKDKLGNTALHWACIKKLCQTSLLILDGVVKVSVIDVPNNEKKTPLHISARNGLVEVTRELLKKGASVLSVDDGGLTPALSCAPNHQVAQCLALILQALPSVISEDNKNDPLKLVPFYKTLSLIEIPPTPSNILQRSSPTQTNISLIRDPDMFEIRQMFGIRLNPPLNHKPANKLPRGKSPIKHKTQNQLKQVISLDTTGGEYFVVEQKDFHYDSSFEEQQKDFRQITTALAPTCTASAGNLGLNLHKSVSDMSIAVQDGLQLRSKTTKDCCRECIRLQHRCADCVIKHVVRQHLQGKTSAQQFEEFVSKGLSDEEIAKDFKRKFMQAVEVIGRELEEESVGKLRMSRRGGDIGRWCRIQRDGALQRKNKMGRRSDSKPTNLNNGVAIFDETGKTTDGLLAQEHSDKTRFYSNISSESIPIISDRICEQHTNSHLNNSDNEFY